MEGASGIWARTEGHPRGHPWSVLVAGAQCQSSFEELAVQGLQNSSLKELQARHGIFEVQLAISDLQGYSIRAPLSARKETHRHGGDEALERLTSRKATGTKRQKATGKRGSRPVQWD